LDDCTNPGDGAGGGGGVDDCTNTGDGASNMPQVKLPDQIPLSFIQDRPWARDGGMRTSGANKWFIVVISA
jgi:hypothetical protein